MVRYQDSPLCRVRLVAVPHPHIVTPLACMHPALCTHSSAISRRQPWCRPPLRPTKRRHDVATGNLLCCKPHPTVLSGLTMPFCSTVHRGAYYLLSPARRRSLSRQIALNGDELVIQACNLLVVVRLPINLPSPPAQSTVQRTLLNNGDP